MERSTYDSLSPRELECLRLVAQGLETKQIAARLAIRAAPDRSGRQLNPDTVDGYIKSAMNKLGTSRRKDAARIVCQHEGQPPQWLGDQPSGVDPQSSSPPSGAPAPRAQPHFPAPFRRRGEVNNELSIGWRLLWIPMLAIGLAVGFGMLTSGLKVAADLVGSSRLLSH